MGHVLSALSGNIVRHCRADSASLDIARQAVVLAGTFWDIAVKRRVTSLTSTGTVSK